MKFTTDEGKEVVINPAPFQLAGRLKRAIHKELSKIGIDLGYLNFKTEITADILKAFSKMALIIDSSEEVEALVFACLERCLYDKEKITVDTFEPVEMRAYYYKIIGGCLKENLFPFYKNLPLLFNELISSVINSQKST
jgi:hypothetical protein